MASSKSSKISTEWDLSLYELQRTPQEVITDDDTEIGVSFKVLKYLLICPICLELFNKTMTTKCLHR